VFTGIIEATGTVVDLGPLRQGARRLRVATELSLAAVPLGGSVAVNGVCLTVVAKSKGKSNGRTASVRRVPAREGGRLCHFDADLGPETLAATTLGGLRPQARVHLERPLRLGDPLGGHLVAGHVDGVGEVTAQRPLGETLELEVAAPRSLAPYLAPKGSITIDGVSLTINRIRGRTFSVTLIPHTLAVTALGSLREKSPVNLEADLLAKHVARLLTSRGLWDERPGRVRLGR